MTPEEMADVLYDMLGLRKPRRHEEEDDPIGVAIHEFIAAEQEACAQVAETTQFKVAIVGECDIFRHIEGGYTTPVIAAAIRARRSEPMKTFNVGLDTTRHKTIVSVTAEEDATINALIAKAVATEREACSSVAEQEAKELDHADAISEANAVLKVAMLIRARSTSPQTKE